MLILSYDLVFLHGGLTPECRAVVDKHFEGYCTLQFMTRGAVELSYDNRRYEMAGAWFWTAFPGPLIRFRAAPGRDFWTHRYVAFAGPLVGRWKAMGLWPEAPQPAPDGRELVSCFDDLLTNSRRTDRWGRMRAVNRLESILIDLAETRALNAPREPWLDVALDALEPSKGLAPDYETIAAHCGMGLSTLRRRFKTATGTTLHDYMLQQRIALARELLGDTDLPVKAIATRLGYNDVYYFSNQFKRQSGTAPGAYRKSRQS